MCVFDLATVEEEEAIVAVKNTESSVVCPAYIQRCRVHTGSSYQGISSSCHRLVLVSLVRSQNSCSV